VRSTERPVDRDQHRSRGSGLPGEQRAGVARVGEQAVVDGRVDVAEQRVVQPGGLDLLDGERA
jgi:hypothetical protein